MSTLGKAVKKVFVPLGKKDRRLARRIVLRAVKNCLNGTYADADEALDDLEAFASKVGAVDWDAVLRFIQGLQPIIEELIAMCMV